jgi:predicted HTH transcriptional regulator
MGRNANNDRFELKIRNCISGQNSRFNPEATGKVSISFEELQEGTICRVDVESLPKSEVLNFDRDVYVRDGNQTLKLDGRALIDWIQRRTQQSSNPADETD